MVAAVSIVADASLFSIAQVERSFSPVVIEVGKKISLMLGHDGYP